MASAETNRDRNVVPRDPARPREVQVMSLLQRVERAQQAAAERAASAGAPDASGMPEPGRPSALVPVMAPAAPTSASVQAREGYLREIRARLQTEVVGAFDTLLDVAATDVRGKVEGIVDRVVARMASR